MSLTVHRTIEMAAIFMIGDGLLGLLKPTRHVDLWQSEMPALNPLVHPFTGKPNRRRLYGVLQVGAGLMLATACTNSGNAAP
jgi:hypothetical protein